MKETKKLLLHLLLSLLLIIIYIELSHFWVDCGGVSSKIKSLELPILLLGLLLLYQPSMNILKNTFLSLTTILGLYLSYDIFYYYLARSPRLSDFSNVNILSDFSLLMSSGFIAITIIIVAPILYGIYGYKKIDKKPILYVLLSIKIILLISLIYSSNNFSNYLLKKFNYFNWSQAKTIQKNGRFASFFYYGIQSNQANKKLNLYRKKKIDVNQIIFGDFKIKDKRNIYIVILESFIDPRLIKNTSFNRSPLSDNMKKYLNENEFSYARSPVYGGGTAQAEFEILTGIKALSKVNSIEFNVLEGNQISGFLNILKQNGYAAHATIASSSEYFNSKTAYESIGFDEVIFLENCDDFQKSEGDDKIFDGNVYDYNIRKLKQNNFKKPYIHYTLGMYGHFPYNRNIKNRPDKISVSHKDTRVSRIANQFYYRTKALADYINNILTIDPQSIIYISSDHIPPLLTNGVEYKKSKQTNIALLLINGKTKNIHEEYFYNIPRLIYKELSNNNNLKLTKIKNLIQEKIYFKALSESLHTK